MATTKILNSPKTRRMNPAMEKIRPKPLSGLILEMSGREFVRQEQEANLREIDDDGYEQHYAEDGQQHFASERIVSSQTK